MSHEPNHGNWGETITEVHPRLQRPKKYQVLLHNDDFTTMDFVVFVLEFVFHKSPAEAQQIMLQVHTQGMGRCGVYPHDIAETKVATVHELARQHEFPLKSSMEEV